MVPQCICHLVEELCYLLVRFLLHRCQDLFQQVWLVSAAGFHDQLAGGGTLDLNVSGGAKAAGKRAGTHFFVGHCWVEFAIRKLFGRRQRLQSRGNRDTELVDLKRGRTRVETARCRVGCGGNYSQRRSQRSVFTNGEFRNSVKPVAWQCRCCFPQGHPTCRIM